ncbi:MAG TPA: hypothetical protein ENH29_00700 [Bacteroidetes bacterium]|nr:hypothetical protein [Bacteroidota bacterium]
MGLRNSSWNGKFSENYLLRKRKNAIDDFTGRWKEKQVVKSDPALLKKIETIDDLGELPLVTFPITNFYGETSYRLQQRQNGVTRFCFSGFPSLPPYQRRMFHNGTDIYKSVPEWEKFY